MSKIAFNASRGTYFMLNPDAPEDGGDVCFIGVDTDDGPEHILYSLSVRNKEADPVFAADIDAQGVLQPIIVRKNGPTAELVFGRRRLMGTRLANKWRRERGDEPRLLPALKFQGSDAELLEAMIAENAHRQDETPLERARQAQTLFKIVQNKARVARACNVTPQTVDTWLKLGDLAKEVQAEVESGALAASAAVELVDLKFEDQVAKLDEIKKAMPAAPSNGKSNGKSKRMSRRDVAKAVNPDRPRTPSMKEKRKVVEALKEGDLEDPGSLTILRWSIGELRPTAIKGLTKVLE